jgi:hypothetical protein
MVSRSTDGALLIPSLRVRGVVPVRGSSGQDGIDKGGAGALTALTRHSRTGAPVYLAVDGPRGPRNYVRRGIAQLAMDADAVVLVAIALPSRRGILTRSWDRFQVPFPFARIDVFFAPPTLPSDAADAEGLRALIMAKLVALEVEHDPAEASYRGRRKRRCTGEVTPT